MDVLKNAKSDELLFFFRINSKSDQFPKMKRVFYEYMDMRFHHPKIRKFILHDEHEESGKFLVIKKDPSRRQKTPPQAENPNWTRLKLDGKSNLRVYSSSIDNRAIYEELEQFLRNHQNLQNEFNIVSNTEKDFYLHLNLNSNSLSKRQMEQFRDRFDEVISRLRTKHANDPIMSQKLENSLFYSSFKNKFDKRSPVAAAVFCTDLQMRSEFIDLIDKNRDPLRLRKYLDKFSFDRLRTTDERKFDLSSQTDYSELETFIEDFYQNKRAQFADPSIQSETVPNSPKAALKLTQSSLFHEMYKSRSNRPMLVLFHNKNDPNQHDFLNRFEHVAQEVIDSRVESKVDFMRINTAKNSNLADAHIQSPLVKFVRRQPGHNSPVITFAETGFEQKLRAAAQTIALAKQVKAKEFFEQSPLDISALLRDLRTNLV